MTNSSYLEGEDVSSGAQGYVNWPAQHAAGMAFAYVKGTQGIGFTDDQFQNNYRNAKAAGILVGAYHFYMPSLDPVAQARHFLAVIGKVQPGDLPPAVDVEGPGDGAGPLGPIGLVVPNLKLFINYVQAATGRTVLIYSYSDMWVRQLGNPQDFAHTNPLWFARYAGTPNPLPGGWHDAAVWQYTDQGKVAGMHVDRDRFAGTMADLQKFAGIVEGPGAVGRYVDPVTGKTVQGGFLDFYRGEPKALAYWGRPLTEEQAGTVGGWSGTVQYFERARFEWHGDHVELGLLGAEEVAAAGK